MPAQAVALVDYAGFWRRFWGALIDGFIVGIPALIVEFAAAGHARGFLATTLIGYGISLPYYLWGYGRGQTVGCMLLQLRMEDVDTGGVPGYAKAAERHLAQFVIGITLVLPFVSGLWMLWDPKRQTWQDKAAGTIVVNA